MKHNTYLCEECLKCRDPNIYCKFRSSCPIWFLSKRKEGLDAEEKIAKSAFGNKHTVTFLPDDKKIMVSDGITLLDAATSAGVHLNASCGGKGLCGKCKLIIEAGHIESRPDVLLSEKEKKENYVLACMSEIFCISVNVAATGGAGGGAGKCKKIETSLNLSNRNS